MCKQILVQLLVSLQSSFPILPNLLLEFQLGSFEVACVVVNVDESEL